MKLFFRKKFYFFIFLLTGLLPCEAKIFTIFFEPISNAKELEINTLDRFNLSPNMVKFSMIQNCSSLKKMIFESEILVLCFSKELDFQIYKYEQKKVKGIIHSLNL